MKNAVILAATELGYFRAKKAEKQAQIIDTLARTEAARGADIATILAEEVEARKADRIRKQAARLAKIEEAAARPLAGGVEDALAHVVKMPPGVYIVSAAQNNTHVNRTALSVMENMADHYGAQLLICPFTYNKNGFQQGQDTSGLWYDPAIKGYLTAQHIDLGGIHVLGFANVLPTAKNPLQGFANATPAGIDAIIPASKIALQCTAALKGSQGKRLFSTGCLTLSNYVLRRAGAVAASEHHIGALFVDTTGERPEVRQLELMPWSDYISDCGIEFYADGSKVEACPLAIQLGDVHAEKMDECNLISCLNLIEQYEPQNLVVHDVCDFSSRNHHNIKDSAFIFSQTIQQNTVLGDLQRVGQVLTALADSLPNDAAMLHVIESNHDLAIETWLKNSDFKDDPINAETYLALMAEMYRSIRESGSPRNMLEYALLDMIGIDPASIVFHETDSSVKLGDPYGIEHGCHGDKGANGARGSVQGFRALGVPMNTGHTHTPSICGAVYTAGVAGSLEMGYNVGPSSWAIASIITWGNGQRQIVFH